MTSAQRRFGEASLEASAVVKCARFGRRLELGKASGGNGFARTLADKVAFGGRGAGGSFSHTALVPVRDLEPAPTIELTPQELNRLSAFLGCTHGDTLWETSGDAVSVAQFTSWCDEVTRVARRVTGEVERVRLEEEQKREKEFMRNVSLSFHLVVRFMSLVPRLWRLTLCTSPRDRSSRTTRIAMVMRR